MKAKGVQQVEATVSALSSRDVYFSHGSVIDSTEAIQLGLNVTVLSEKDELWQKLWLLHCMYEHDCRRDRYLKIFEGAFVSTAIAAPPSK